MQHYSLGWRRHCSGAQRSQESKSRTSGYLYEAEFLNTQDEVLSALEGIGGKEWETVNADVDECAREGDRRMEEGFFDGAMMLFKRNILFEQIGDVEVWSNSQRGLKGKKKSLEDAIMKVMAIFEKNGKGDCGCG